MTSKTLREKLRKLTAEERAELLGEFLPEVCRTVMSRPALMQRMMPKCQAMRSDPDIPGRMQAMMERMRHTMKGEK